jgi:hypothetical protein
MAPRSMCTCCKHERGHVNCAQVDCIRCTECESTPRVWVRRAGRYAAAAMLGQVSIAQYVHGSADENIALAIRQCMAWPEYDETAGVRVLTVGTPEYDTMIEECAR